MFWPKDALPNSERFLKERLGFGVLAHRLIEPSFFEPSGTAADGPGGRRNSREQACGIRGTVSGSVYAKATAPRP